MTDRISKNGNLQIIFSITLIAVMGVSSITPAFPTIIEYFHIKPHQIGVLITAFTLPGIALTPFMGVLADRLGRKTILVPSLFLFALAGGACTFTRDFHTLTILRVFQGMGATSLGLLNVTLIGDLFEPKQRVEAMGYNASVLSIGTATYPAIGGFLAGLGWYFPFYLPLLAIPVAIIVILKLETAPLQEKQDQKTYFRNAWNNINKPYVLMLFIINILTFIILYGALLSYFPLLMRERFNSPEWQIGLYMSLFSLTTALIASQMKRISQIFSIRIQIIISLLLYSMAMFLMAFSFNHWLILIPIMIFGAGHGMLLPAIQNLLVGFAPMRERAIFMSINSMVLRIGQTLGPVIIGAAFLWNGMEGAFLTGAGIAILMLLVWIGTTLPKTNE